MGTAFSNTRRGFLAALALTLALVTASAAPAAPAPLRVFAAASLTDALGEIGKAYTAETSRPVVFSFASSSVIARQVEAGAPADLFFSADAEWMDYLAARSLIQTATRRNLLGNRLVLIAPSDSRLQLRIAPGFALAAALGRNGRLATGDPDAVPAGRYARSALTSLGVWNSIEDRLIRAENVRAAMLFVDRGEAPLGIVYETDARIDPKVRIIDTFPASSHPPIVYPAALTARAAPGAAEFMAYAAGPKGQAVFRKFGFSIL